MLWAGGLVLLSLVLLLVGPFDWRTQRRLADQAHQVQTQHGGLDRSVQQLRSADAQLSATLAALRTALRERQADSQRLADASAALRARMASDAARDAAHRDLLHAVAASAAATLDRAREADPAAVMARAEKTVLVIRTDVGSGSGVIIDARGLALTNYHVIRLANRLDVAVQKHGSRDTIDLPGARLIAVDPQRDLALIALPPPPPAVSPVGTGTASAAYPALPLRESPASLGESVFAIGNPGAPGFATASPSGSASASPQLLTYTLTTGIVANPRRLDQGRSLIQTTAPINPGNSGGPLCDLKGHLLGIVTLKGTGVEAVGFALDMATVRTFLALSETPGYALGPGALADSLAAYERAHRPEDALLRERRAFTGGRRIALPGWPSELLLAPHGRTLYAVLGRQGSIVEVDLARGAVSRTAKLDALIAGACLEEDGNGLIALCSEPRRIVHIPLATFLPSTGKALSDAVERPLAIAGTRNWLLCLGMDDKTGPVHALIPALSARGTAKLEEYRLSTINGLFAASSGARTLFLAIRTPSSVELSAMPDHAFTTYLDACLASERNPNPDARSAALQQAARAMLSVASTIELSPTLLEADGADAPLLLSVGANQAIFARRLFTYAPAPVRTGQAGTLRLEGEFARSPDFARLQDATQNPRNRRTIDPSTSNLLALLDTVCAVSPDHRFAASASHLYDLRTRQPIRRLPLITADLAFSRDGRALYLADLDANGLVLIDDWQQMLPQVQAGKP